MFVFYLGKNTVSLLQTETTNKTVMYSGTHLENHMSYNCGHKNKSVTFDSNTIENSINSAYRKYNNNNKIGTNIIISSDKSTIQVQHFSITTSAATSDQRAESKIGLRTKISLTLTESSQNACLTDIGVTLNSDICF